MISPAKRGRAVEMMAELLFLEAGFEVFTNVAPDGPADLVVWDGTTFYPIDTKRTQPYIRADGVMTYNVTSKSKIRPGVHYLGWAEDHWTWLSEPPEALSKVIHDPS